MIVGTAEGGGRGGGRGARGGKEKEEEEEDEKEDEKEGSWGEGNVLRGRETSGGGGRGKGGKEGAGSEAETTGYHMDRQTAVRQTSRHRENKSRSTEGDTQKKHAFTYRRNIELKHTHRYKTNTLTLDSRSMRSMLKRTTRAHTCVTICHITTTILNVAKGNFRHTRCCQAPTNCCVNMLGWLFHHHRVSAVDRR